MLDYFLELNMLTSDNPDDMRAQTANVISYNQEDIIERILKSGAGLTRSDVVSVLEAQRQIIYDLLAEGAAVTTDLFNAFPSIQGVFIGAEDSFDSKRHRVKIHLTEGLGLRTVEERVKTKKILPLQTSAYITSITDVKSGSVNNLLTPGKNLRIHGSKLKILGDDPSVGVYFTGAGGDVKVEETDIIENKPTEVMIITPTLSPGEYYVKLVTQFTGSAKPAKGVHTATFERALTVTA
ncbi:MAG: DUF4469 domain-containing protein [Spirochaetaceae bacterium]|jgi:hypothetical protein|nr:DUF4469 domain-containing protein [Spirochaetaceae bacterium]